MIDVGPYKAGDVVDTFGFDPELSTISLYKGNNVVYSYKAYLQIKTN